MVQSINYKEILGGQQLRASFADPVDNGEHCFVENQSIQRDADEEVICACEVRKRLCLLHAQFKHQVYALTGTLHHAAERKDLRNTAVARELAIQYVVERDAEGKSSGAFDNQSVAELADKDTAAELIVPVAHRVQNCFSDNTFIEGRNVKHEKAFLIVLLVVPQIDKLPHTVIASEESDLKLFSLIGRTRRFGGTVLKNDLRLRQILDDCRVLAEQDQAAYVTPSSVIAPQSEKRCFDQRGKLLFSALFDPLGTEVFNGGLVKSSTVAPAQIVPEKSPPVSS